MLFRSHGLTASINAIAPKKSRDLSPTTPPKSSRLSPATPRNAKKLRAGETPTPPNCAPERLKRHTQCFAQWMSNFLIHKYPPPPMKISNFYHSLCYSKHPPYRSPNLLLAPSSIFLLQFAPHPLSPECYFVNVTAIES